jgi:hypothetical protein
MSTTLKRSVSELLDPNPPQVALDLRNQPDAKRARTMDPNDIIDLCHSQSVELETPLPSPTLKSTIAPATPERKASEPKCPSAPSKDHKDHKQIDWDEFAKTHTPAEVLKAYSERYTMVDHVLETKNVGNDVVVTGVKEVIPVPMIPFTQVDEPVEDDEDELMTQPFEQTQPEETQVEATRPQIEATQPLETQSTATQVEETVPFDDPEPIITAEQQVETTQQLETIPEEDDDGLVDQHAESMAEERSQTAWITGSFNQAVKRGADWYFRFETMDRKMTQFTEGGHWNGLSSRGLEDREVFMNSLREQFLTIPIAKEHGITMAHFEDESVRIVGWAISDSMINF